MMFLESRHGRRFLFPSGNVSMGFALPAALGAKCVSNNVVCITGDGGLMMQLAELATAAQENLNVTVVVLNDNGYGAIRHYQYFNFGSRYAGVELKNPDFARLAEAFDLIGISIQTCDELESSLKEAFESNKTTVLDVHVDPDEVALPDWIIKSFGEAKT
jgi:acetolactate synthase-1/2/3 large subunit